MSKSYNMLNFFNLFNHKKSSKIKPQGENSEREQEFSKTLLIQESLLIWIHTIAVLVLAYVCVFRNSFAELPWLTAMVSFPWAAYAVSQHAYYRKAERQNSQGGITYELAMQNYMHTNDGQEFEDDVPVG